MTNPNGVCFDLGKITVKHDPTSGRVTKILAEDGTELHGIREIDFHATHEGSRVTLTVDHVAIELDQANATLQIEEHTLVEELRRRGYKVEIDDSDIAQDLTAREDPGLPIEGFREAEPRSDVARHFKSQGVPVVEPDPFVEKGG